MKKMAFVVLGVTLVFAVAWSSDGLCQCDSGTGIQIGQPNVYIRNLKNSPILGDGTFFGIAVDSNDPAQAMSGLVEISAQNLENPDESIYEFDLTPTLRTMYAEWSSQRYFTGQGGIYELTIKQCMFETPDSCTLQTASCQTDRMPPNLPPLPVPKNLKVSFKSGPTTPTLSFDPAGWVPDAEGEFYRIAIYDKDYTRRIYNVRICKHNYGTFCRINSNVPSVTFPDYRGPASTGENLVPGEEYLFMVDLIKELPQITPGLRRNALLGTNYKFFTVPEK